MFTLLKKLLFPYYKKYQDFSTAKMGIPYITFLKFKLFGGKYYWDKGKNTIVVKLTSNQIFQRGSRLK